MSMYVLNCEHKKRTGLNHEMNFNPLSAMPGLEIARKTLQFKPKTPLVKVRFSDVD